LRAVTAKIKNEKKDKKFKIGLEKPKEMCYNKDSRYGRSPIKYLHGIRTRRFMWKHEERAIF
jgi:hypothetical protein